MKKTRISVGMGSCGIASGAEPVYDKLKLISKKHSKKIEIVKTGCLGICKYEPIVEVFQDNRRITYVNVKENDIDNIIKHTINNTIFEKCAIKTINHDITEDNFYKKQTRIVLENCGLIDPENINEYVLKSGYKALEKVLNSMSKEDVISEIKNSCLRGRGGAGFYTGIKWELAYKETSEIKYVCCNADEGDPGAFMDRAILEGDPHSVIEAMIISAYTIGASEGYIYVRAEYPLAVERLKIAIKQAKKKKFLGKNIMKTNFSFDLKIRLGAGAFVCGEETALMLSIEGKRGEPTMKPPFPTTKGLYEKPTLINNVETLANIPKIILNGSEWFSNFGTLKSKGTKVFALGGNINKTGLIEVPIGMTLKEIIYEIGGGIPNNKQFKAAQTGGPSGGCIPSSLIDIEMDYESLLEIGSMMGSGGLIIMDEDTCMVDIAKFFLEFTVDESCGKCIPCRIGTKRVYEMLEKITNGLATFEDIEKIENLSNNIKITSFCGLGQSSINPVLSTLRYYKDEYIDHIVNKKCLAKKCKKLVEYNIIADKCVGCSLCSKLCPVHCIIGEIKKTFVINKKSCIKCGVCKSTCKFDAIEVLGGEN